MYRRLIDVGQTGLVSSRDADGKAGDNCSEQPSISSSGRVPFARDGPGCPAQDPPDRAADVYVWVNGQQTMLSGSVLGVRPGPSSRPVVAHGGALVAAFQTTILGAPGDGGSTTQVARNLSDGSLSVLLPGGTRLVSRTPVGAAANGPSDAPAISADGRRRPPLERFPRPAPGRAVAEAEVAAVEVTVLAGAAMASRPKPAGALVGQSASIPRISRAAAHHTGS